MRFYYERCHQVFDSSRKQLLSGDDRTASSTMTIHKGVKCMTTTDVELPSCARELWAYAGIGIMLTNDSS